MEATLRYNLPEDQDDFDTAINGWKYRHVLSDLDDRLRDKWKYGNEAWADKARELLRDICTEMEVRLE